MGETRTVGAGERLGGFYPVCKKYHSVVSEVSLSYLLNALTE